VSRIRTAFFCLGAVIGTVAVAADFGFESLRELIESRGITSVGALIEALPADLRSHYTLVFASRSLQGASTASPRAILFGSDAAFIVTFNGDPAQRGGSDVETMEFDPRSNRFLFREVQFPADGGGRVSISETNSARCVACHGQPARPIWDTPPSWPGVYGERYGAGLSAREAKGMHEFLTLQPGHARYRHLLGASAFADRATYVASARAVYNGIKTTPPNAQLSALLTALNNRSIMSEMASSPAFEAHRYALLAAAEGSCGPLADYYPAPMNAQIAAQLREFMRTSASTDRLQAETVAARLAGESGGYRRGPAAARHVELRFVVERSLGLTTQHWTLALEGNTYDLSAPEGTQSLAQVLFEWIAVNDTALRSLHHYRSFTGDDRYCEHLRRQSVSALEAWYAAHPLQQTPASAAASASTQAAVLAGPELLERCVSCHTGKIGPLIPFADPDALAKRLVSGNYTHGRLLDEILYRLSPEAGPKSMPLGITITSAQRHGLEEYFLGLAPRGAIRDAQ
jgi:mono/diheme cytochrome c family protein